MTDSAIYGTIVLVKVLKTAEFQEWYLGLRLEIRAQIDARMARIEKFDHLGNWKYLGAGLSELKWKSGLRVYFSRVGNQIILLVYGGTKNVQKKDIEKAKNVLRRYTET